MIRRLDDGIRHRPRAHLPKHRVENGTKAAGDVPYSSDGVFEEGWG